MQGTQKAKPDGPTSSLGGLWQVRPGGAPWAHTYLGPTAPQRPQALGFENTQVCLPHVALPDEEEPVLFRRVIIQPLGEACVGPLRPLQVETQSEESGYTPSCPVGVHRFGEHLWDSWGQRTPDTGPKRQAARPLVHLPNPREPFGSVN